MLADRHLDAVGQGQLAYHPGAEEHAVGRPYVAEPVAGALGDDLGVAARAARRVEDQVVVVVAADGDPRGPAFRGPASRLLEAVLLGRLSRGGYGDLDHLRPPGLSYILSVTVGSCTTHGGQGG